MTISQAIETALANGASIRAVASSLSISPAHAERCRQDPKYVSAKFAEAAVKVMQEEFSPKVRP